MATKRARMVRVAKNQTGKTHKRVDERILAKKPGLRVSESGKTYDERRANRSDKSKRRRLWCLQRKNDLRDESGIRSGLKILWIRWEVLQVPGSCLWGHHEDLYGDALCLHIKLERSDQQYRTLVKLPGVNGWSILIPGEISSLWKKEKLPIVSIVQKTLREIMWGIRMYSL